MKSKREVRSLATVPCYVISVYTLLLTAAELAKAYDRAAGHAVRLRGIEKVIESYRRVLPKERAKRNTLNEV